MNCSSVPSKKTLNPAILSVLAITILTSCVGVPKRDETSNCEQSSAFETVEKMRDFSTQFKMGDIDNCNRWEKIMAEFRRIGKEAVPALACALKDPDVQMRRNAIFVLQFLPVGDWKGKQPVDIRAAIPSLISAIEDPDNEVRLGAAYALGVIKPDAREAVPALTRILKDSEPGPRCASAIALGNISVAAKTAPPALQEALKEAVPTLTRMLKDPEPEPRCASAIALGNIGAAAKTALPALQEALNDTEYDVRKFSKQSIDLIEKACAQNDQRTE